MTNSSTLQVYVSGQRFDLWEDPDRPFGCAPTDLTSYYMRGDWVLLFNAVSLTAERDGAGPGS